MPLYSTVKPDVMCASVMSRLRLGCWVAWSSKYGGMSNSSGSGEGITTTGDVVLNSMIVPMSVISSLMTGGGVFSWVTYSMGSSLVPVLMVIALFRGVGDLIGTSSRDLRIFCRLSLFSAVSIARLGMGVWGSYCGEGYSINPTLWIVAPTMPRARVVVLLVEWVSLALGCTRLPQRAWVWLGSAAGMLSLVVVGVGAVPGCVRPFGLISYGQSVTSCGLVTSFLRPWIKSGVTGCSLLLWNTLLIFHSRGNTRWYVSGPMTLSIVNGLNCIASNFGDGLSIAKSIKSSHTRSPSAGPIFHPSICCIGKTVSSVICPTTTCSMYGVVPGVQASVGC